MGGEGEKKGILCIWTASLYKFQGCWLNTMSWRSWWPRDPCSYWLRLMLHLCSGIFLLLVDLGSPASQVRLFSFFFIEQLCVDTPKAYRGGDVITFWVVLFFCIKTHIVASVKGRRGAGELAHDPPRAGHDWTAAHAKHSPRYEGPRCMHQGYKCKLW